MKKDSLRKCELKHVRLRPIAKRFDGGKGGVELSPIDDDWLVGRLTDEGMPISNSRTQHATVLGYDHIHHFTTDPQRGSGYGFLTLTIQIHIGGRELWIEPNVRP